MQLKGTRFDSRDGIIRNTRPSCTPFAKRHSRNASNNGRTAGRSVFSHKETTSKGIRVADLQVCNCIFPDQRSDTFWTGLVCKNGGVCIFIYEDIQLPNINLKKFCKEKDLEVCAVKLHFQSCEICIITIYRSPSGNFQYLIDNLEKILTLIYSTTKEIIICGDININYLKDSSHKQVLDSLLASYGLYSTVQFPPRIQNKSSSAINNLFINIFKFSNFSLYPIINGMSDHDAQFLITRNIFEQSCNNYFTLIIKLANIQLMILISN
jgi:hypothetical protein